MTTRTIAVLQIVSIAMSAVAIVFALVCLGAATIWKGPSGEWARLALLPPFFINLPTAVVAFVMGLAARGGDARLRKIAIGMAVAAFIAPFAAAVVGGLR